MKTHLERAVALHRLDQAARLGRWGRHQAAIEAYRQACAGPLDAVERYNALVGLTSSLEAIGECEQAIATCHEAIRDAPGRSPAYGVLALVSMRADRLDDAAAAASDACLRDDRSPEMRCLVASIALRRSRVDEAIEAASAALDRDPASQRAQAMRMIAEAWRDGRSDAPDMYRWVRVSEPRPPSGFASMDAFNRSLSDAIRGHDLLEPNESGGPLVDGARLHDLFDMAPALAEALRTMFLSEALLYAAPIGSDIAPRLEVRGWANVMQAGAYEKPHLHEGAWLSGVYYPQLPDAGAEGGEIVFGPHDLGPNVPSPVPFTVSPKAGQMVMFPSWLHHSTLPFAGEGVRISVAADILRPITSLSDSRGGVR